MQYHVIAPDGQLYGPADEATLAQWVLQGRVDAGTSVVRQDGVTLPLTAVPGVFGGVPGFVGASAKATGPGLVPPSAGKVGFLGMGSRDRGGLVGRAYMLALVSVLCLPLFPAIAGLACAVRANRAGEKGAAGAIVANGFGVLIGLAMVAMMVSFGQTVSAIGSLSNR